MPRPNPTDVHSFCPVDATCAAHFIQQGGDGDVALRPQGDDDKRVRRAPVMGAHQDPHGPTEITFTAWNVAAAIALVDARQADSDTRRGRRQ